MTGIEHAAVSGRIAHTASVWIVCSTRANAEALCTALKSEARDVRLTASSLAQAWRSLGRVDHDVVVIGAPIAEGLPLGQRVRAAHPHTAIVVFGALRDAREITAWRRSGARTCLDREASFGELRDAIRDAVAFDTNERRVPSQSATAADAASDDKRPLLTAREREILEMIACGLSNKEIAGALVLETTTVKNHVQRVLQKLGLRSRVDAAMYVDANRRPT